MARYPETNEAIQMFAKGMSSRQVAEKLNLDDVTVKNIKYNYRDEIDEARRVNERKAKAEALHAMMAKPAPASAVEPEPAQAQAPEAEPVMADELPPEPESERVEAKAENWTDFLPDKPERTRMPDGRYAMEGTKQPQTRRLKVCGYIGEGGRVYAIEGPVIKIAGLASKYTPGELRTLLDELQELLEAVGGQEGCA